MKSFRGDLLQLHLSLLRQTSGEHVTSQLIQSLRQKISEPSVTSGCEDVAIGIVSDSWNSNQTIVKFIDDEENDDVENERVRGKHFCCEIKTHKSICNKDTK